MILRPDFNLKNIYEIDLKQLKKLGIKAILLDLDSTVMVSKSGEFTKRTLEWFEEVRKDFYVAILTNNTNQQYIKQVRARSPFQVIDNAKKPWSMKIRPLLKVLFMQPNEAVIVGDRPLTDILAGKFFGLKTILVGSINEKENLPTKFVRFLERLCICPF